ncbi:MAG: hypothetical protein Q8O07_04210 [Chloroflexota bacterium]|nr:hypothetical protein [Chloroflexota bacterium]
MYNAQPGQTQVVHVKIEDVNIPFLHLVGLMLKIAIAAIPAALIMFLLGLILSALTTGALATVAAMITALLRR